MYFEISEPRHELDSHNWDHYRVDITAISDAGRRHTFPFKSGLALPPIPNEDTIKADVWDQYETAHFSAEGGMTTFESILIYLSDELGAPNIREAIEIAHALLELYEFILGLSQAEWADLERAYDEING